MTFRAGTRTASVYGALLLMIGVMLPFMPVWLAARGFSIADVAWALALQSVVRVVAMPVVTYWADRLAARRRFIIVLSGIAAVMMLMANLSDSVVAITAFVVLSAFAWSPVMPMLDAVAVEQSEAGHYDYGRVRIAGSVTFIAGSLGAGAMLTVLPATDLGWLLLATHVLLAVSALALPRLGAARQGLQRDMSLKAAGKVMLTASFILLILVAGLTQASHALYYGFGSLHWEAQGFSGVTIGTLWSIGVIAEIVLFIYARKPLNRFGPVGLLMGGAALGAVRWAVMAFDPPLAMTALLQVLHAGSYALTHLGTIYFIRRKLDEDFAGTAQGLFGAISGGVIMTAAISLAGWAYAVQGGAAYAWMAAMCGLALVLAAVLKRSTP
jgi:PPP family 3-phenylpropionic acid transporter